MYSTQVHSKRLTASQAASVYEAETTYTISRKGKNIGKHILKIEAKDNRINVSVDSTIAISVLKIPVFTFRYLSNESWQDDQLLQVESTTTTNKKVETASLRNDGNRSLIANDDGEKTTALIDYATNHWNRSAVEQSSLFNTVKGVKSAVTVKMLGQETLDIEGTSIATTHYAYSGDIIAESWYDENNRWVKLAFLGSDGSQITYLIDNP